MILKNTQEPFNEVGPFDPQTETGANWIAYYKLHGFVEVGGKKGKPSDALVGKTLSGELEHVKKAVDDMDKDKAE